MIARGVCWNTSGNPTTSNGNTPVGTGIGTFSGALTGLTPGTLYYVRAYATNSVGTAYGSEETFTTMSQANVDTTVAQPTEYTVTISGPTTLHYGTQVTFTSTYTGTASSFTWYLDTATTIGTGSGLSITPTVSTYTYGSHVLMLVVTDANGISYSGTFAIDVQN